ncbi:hydroxymethylglutaryl-CoA lyase, partial [Paracoccaceae bacterium]|nr:hydroxymethylglutaryl-CoA lyase [Paracoccaceae bacterium]
GLQNEARPIPLSEKIALVDCLSQAGFKRIEIASFVSPKWVPQMAQSAEVLAGILRVSGVSYAALTPNRRGFDDALHSKADEVAIFAAASEGFSQANLNTDIAGSLQRFGEVAVAAKEAELPVRGYISCVTDCPYEGVVDPDQVRRVAETLLEMGCYEISLGDTIGHASPARIAALLDVVVPHVPPYLLAGHYHDTRGLAWENVQVSLDYGLRVFDASVGGLGGCPYAPGAAGNIDTESLHHNLTQRGYDTGLEATQLARAAVMAHAMRGAQNNV